jgi:hypothetical protein
MLAADTLASQAMIDQAVDYAKEKSLLHEASKPM